MSAPHRTIRSSRKPTFLGTLTLNGPNRNLTNITPTSIIISVSIGNDHLRINSMAAEFQRNRKIWTCQWTRTAVRCNTMMIISGPQLMLSPAGMVLLWSMVTVTVRLRTPTTAKTRSIWGIASIWMAWRYRTMTMMVVTRRRWMWVKSLKRGRILECGFFRIVWF